MWAWIAASTTNYHLKGCPLNTESGRSQLNILPIL